MRADVPWAVGFIAGAVLTSFVCGALGIGGILRLVLVVGVGVGGGVLGEYLAKRKP